MQCMAMFVSIGSAICMCTSIGKLDVRSGGASQKIEKGQHSIANKSQMTRERKRKQPDPWLNSKLALMPIILSLFIGNTRHGCCHWPPLSYRTLCFFFSILKKKQFVKELETKWPHFILLIDTTMCYGHA